MLRWLVQACVVLLLAAPAGVASAADRDPRVDFALRRAALELAAGRPDAAARVLSQVAVDPRATDDHVQLVVLLHAQAALLAGEPDAVLRLQVLLDAPARLTRAQAALHLLASMAVAPNDSTLDPAAMAALRARAARIWIADAREIDGHDAELAAIGDVLVAWQAWQDGDADRAQAATRRAKTGNARGVARILAAEWQFDHADARAAADAFASIAPGKGGDTTRGDAAPRAYADWLEDWAGLGRARSLIAAAQPAAAGQALNQVRRTPHLEQYAAFLHAQIAYAGGDLEETVQRLAALELAPWNGTLASEAALLRVQMELDRGHLAAAESLSMHALEQPWFLGEGPELELALQLDVDALHQAQVTVTLAEMARCDVLRQLPAAMQLAPSTRALRLEPAAAAAHVAILQPYRHALSPSLDQLDARARAAALQVRALAQAQGLAQQHEAAAARSLAQRQQLLARAGLALREHTAQLDAFGLMAQRISRALGTYHRELVAQESAWNRRFTEQFARLAASLDALRRATTRLTARYPADRSVRPHAQVDQARAERQAIVAMQDSLRVLHADLTQRYAATVRSVLHDFEPRAAAAAVASLEAALARLRDRTAELAARLNNLDAADQQAYAQTRTALETASARLAAGEQDLAAAAQRVSAERLGARRQRHALYVEAARHAAATAAFHAALADTAADDARRLARLEHAAARLEEFLRRHPDALRADEALYRLGEIHLQQASVQHRADLAAFLARGGDASDAPVPVEDYADAIDAYDRLLRTHVDSPRAVDAHYQLGFLLAEMGRLEDSAAHLDAFLAAAPADDPRSGRAALRLGDDALQLEDGARAGAAFAQAAASPARESSDLGLFKLGWCHYEHDRLDAARQALRTLLDRAQQAPADSTSRARELQPETLELLALCFAEDHTAPEAAAVLDTWGPPAYEFVLLRRMAQLFAGRAQYDEAIVAHETLLARHPLRPEIAAVVDEWVQLVRIHRGDAAAFAVAAELGPHFAPDGRWAAAARRAGSDTSVQLAWQSRLVDEDARVAQADSLAAWLAVPERAARHMAKLVRGAAVFAHQQARTDSANVRAHLQRAVRHYEQTLQQFPGADDAATTWLYLGEARHALGAHAQAADAYAAVATSGADSALTHRAAVAEIAALDAAAAADATQLQRYAALARRHVSRWPADAQGIDALERVGELAFRAEQDTLAVNAYELFAARSPERRRAALALKVVGDVAWRRQEFEPASAHYARAAASARQAGADSLSAVLDVLVPGSLARAAEQRESGGDRRGAAGLLERVAEEHPHFAHADRSLYQAAELRTAVGDTARAVEDHVRLVAAYPRSEFRPDAWLQLARLEDARGRRREAAQLYARFAAHYHDHAQRRAAQLRAGDLFAQSGDAKAADALFAAVLHDVHPAGAKPSEPELAAELWLRRARSDADPVQAASHFARGLECGTALASVDAAEARFHVTEQARPGYEAITLRQPLRESLAAKQRALEPLIAGYTQVAQAGVEPWHAAASLRIGAALADLADALRSSQPPAELEGDDLYAYQEAIFLQAQQLEDRAVESWSMGLGAALAAAHTDTWTEQLQAGLYPMLARRIPTRPTPLFVIPPAQ